MFSIPFISIVFCSIVLAYSLNVKFLKDDYLVPSKFSNGIVLFILFFCGIGYCYLFYPMFFDKLSDQVTLDAYPGEIINLHHTYDESSDNHSETLEVQVTIITNEIKQIINPSFFKNYAVGDTISVAYNDERDELIELSISAIMSSATMIFTCICVTILILMAGLYSFGLLSLKKINKIIKTYTIYIVFPFIFISIIVITILYLI